MTLKDPTTQSMFLLYIQSGHGFAASCRNSNLDPKQTTEELRKDVELLERIKLAAGTMPKGQAEALKQAITEGKAKKGIPQKVLRQKALAKNLNPSFVITDIRLWADYLPAKPMTDKKIHDCLIETRGNSEEAAVWLGMSLQELTNKINKMADPILFKKSVEFH